MHAPLLNVFGSFFPAWMLCAALAVPVTAAVRSVLVRLKLDGELGPRAIVYPGMAVLVSCSLWLVFFRN